jgi:hypothetical protein
MTRMYEFSIGRFTIAADITPSTDLDLSWDDTGETRDGLERGTLEAFDTKVSVSCNGVEIASDWLCESIYSDPAEFFSDHRDRDPMNRNCSVMRAANGQNVSICHYFPGMISAAITQARQWMVGARLAA